jgi:hypothetical protein
LRKIFLCPRFQFQPGPSFGLNIGSTFLRKHFLVLVLVDLRGVQGVIFGALYFTVRGFVFGGRLGPFVALEDIMVVHVGHAFLSSASGISIVIVLEMFVSMIVLFLVLGEPYFIVCWYTWGRLLASFARSGEPSLIFSGWVVGLLVSLFVLEGLLVYFSASGELLFVLCFVSRTPWVSSRGLLVFCAKDGAPLDVDALVVPEGVLGFGHFGFLGFFCL